MTKATQKTDRTFTPRLPHSATPTLRNPHTLQPPHSATPTLRNPHTPQLPHSATPTLSNPPHYPNLYDFFPESDSFLYWYIRTSRNKEVAKISFRVIASLLHSTGLDKSESTWKIEYGTVVQKKCHTGFIIYFPGVIQVSCKGERMSCHMRRVKSS